MNMTEPSRLKEILDRIVPKNIAALPVYQPGKPIEEVERELGITGAIKLASNESVTGPSPRAVAAMQNMLDRVAEYPDGGAFQLRNAVAKELDVGADELIFGAGCNEVIHLAVRALCRPGQDDVITHDFAFISYKIAALAHGAPFTSTPTNDVLGCDVDALLERASDKTRIVFLANPNNPTGSHLSPEELKRVVLELPEAALLVVDEAYFEYASRSGAAYQSSLELRALRPMMLTLRTFSKIHGLAGLRVGYGVAQRELIEIIGKARRPFNVNSLAQAAATAAAGDRDHVAKAAAAALAGIAQLREGASALNVKAYPSLGNFVLIDVGGGSAPIAQALQRRGVIVRPMAAWGLPNCIRVSTGTPEQNQRAIDTLAKVLAE